MESGSHSGGCCGSAHLDERDPASLLRAAKLRVTRQRLDVLAALARQQRPVAIELLRSEMGESTCDLVTIYRTLATFEKAGLVRRTHFSGAAALYELDGGPDHHHHHVICRVCHRVELVTGCAVAALEESVRVRGYTEVSHTLEFFGVCPSCRPAAAR